MQKLIGYHGTKKQYADLIITEGFKIQPPKKTDNHWLGHGIYFYADYDLAEWWGRTKVAKQNRKYGAHDEPIVIRGCIEADNILDLDNPFELKKFKAYQVELEEQFVEEGVVIDFSQMDTEAKIRCFWMDSIKTEYNIAVIVYTFSKNNPSYVESKYHVWTEERISLGSMGLEYHEKQICVTDNQYIVDRCVVDDSIDEFNEVII